MNSSEKLNSEVNEFIQMIDTTKSTEFNLGRPELDLIPEMEKLAKEGKKTMAIILPYLNEDQPKRTAYLVHTISLIKGNNEVKKTIEIIRNKIIDKPSKTEWDFAAIGECNLMLNSIK